MQGSFLTLSELRILELEAYVFGSLHAHHTWIHAAASWSGWILFRYIYN